MNGDAVCQIAQNLRSIILSSVVHGAVKTTRPVNRRARHDYA